MIRDLTDQDGDPPPYDLCIVGSGPSGATVANELKTSGLRVCVLESGLARPTRRGDRLRRVISDGLTIKDYSRERVLGGSSTTWAGLSSPLDEVDLEPRPFLDHSGWPIRRDELLPFYEEAAARYRFPALERFGPSGFGAIKARGEVEIRLDGIVEKVFLAAAEPQDFGRELGPMYAATVDLYLDATVTALEAHAGSRLVACAVVRDRTGRERRVRAERFVIATGGIENARLLLASTDLCPFGLGNEQDQVGRYLMNHPKNDYGVLHLARPVVDVPYYFGCLHEGFAGYAGLRLSDDRQREHRLLNSYVRFEPLFPWSDSRGVESLVLIAKRSAFFLRAWKAGRRGKVISLRDYSETGDDSDLQNERMTFARRLGLGVNIVIDLPRVLAYLWFRLVEKAGPRIRRVRLRNFMEMEPRPENRVTLADELDEDGRPLPRVRYGLTAKDKVSLVRLHEVLAREFERSGLGRLEGRLGDEERWPIDQDASHHLGTTRMGTDPRTSVVDPDQKVHGVDNVYVAGGSVFPTSGCANPTFTIVALSIRLARHLLETTPATGGRDHERSVSG